ncbi:MAG TPA: ATP-binding protein [Terriglobia bacterium]|nr:ATP-binding protein [Terriglobia bacterium]
MSLRSPIFRKLLWIGFLPAALATLAVDFYLSHQPAALTRSHLLTAALLLLFLAFILAIAAAWVLSSLFIMRIGRLRSFAENLVHSRLPAANPLPGDEDELGSLARALSRAASQWQELLDRLQLESARREAILSSMTEGVLAVDKDLRVIFYNASFARVVGAALSLKERVPLYDLARDPALIEMLSQALTTREPSKQTLALAAADGRIFEVHAAPLAEPGREGAIAILHDITDLERLERVRKDFVANVSHELRTPLTAIRGYTESLLDGALEDPVQNRKFLEIILAHALRLNNIASDLLVLSELESGRKQPDPQRISIFAVAEAALRTVEAEAKLREVALVRGALEDCEILGNKVRLEQALINLLDNAIKFNRAGGHARVDAGPLGADKAFISVSDDGAGIPSEDLPRIFERFYRVDKARSREVGGTGLGLSIVKHAVERMGGTVTVESQLGKGSTFTLVLQAASAPNHDSQ